MLVFTVVFTIMLPNMSIQKFPVFVLCALLPWTFFTTSVSSSIQSITGNGHLIKKVYFPREILPISTVLSNLANLLLSLPVLFLLILLFRIPTEWLGRLLAPDHPGATGLYPGHRLDPCHLQRLLPGYQYHHGGGHPGLVLYDPRFLSGRGAARVDDALGHIASRPQAGLHPQPHGLHHRLVPLGALWVYRWQPSRASGLGLFLADHPDGSGLSGGGLPDLHPSQPKTLPKRSSSSNTRLYRSSMRSTCSGRLSGRRKLLCNSDSRPGSSTRRSQGSAPGLCIARGHEQPVHSIPYHLGQRPKIRGDDRDPRRMGLVSDQRKGLVPQRRNQHSIHLREGSPDLRTRQLAEESHIGGRRGS